MRKLFIAPPIVRKEGFDFLGYHSYSEYNYLQKSFISGIKRRHFEIALDLTSDYFFKTDVIDFGCADGIFLPSLSHYFSSVLGIEREKEFVFLAQEIIKDLALKNVKIINNENVSIQELKTESLKKDYKIIFLLEVLEHVGRNYQSMYEDKITLLKEISSLVNNEGMIIVSVPKMIGLSFLIQHIGLTVLNMKRAKYSFKELMSSAFLGDTSGVEKYWVPYVTHQGFNHKKLEKYLNQDFFIVKKRDDFFQVVYVIKKKQM
jgi:2-polyprenyl-3-methyl-5-hydroxy-6-metoxy-1,4-benzoquinol methylase